MSDQEALKLASVLIGYPENDVWHALDEALDAARHIENESVSEHLIQAIAGMREMGYEALKHHYVNVFDFSESTCLYLTAHEYGDNRARGNAFINLRILLASEGFEQLGEELPDYLPLLFEFLAVCDNEEKTNPVKERLAKCVARILDHLDVDSPYQLVFTAIAELLPAPGDQQFPDREEADQGEMPYPLPFG
ncbi:MAG TPA: nitrate reductase molybdenum cofactor assembly chaperone [Bacillales bacterium]|nr:nitrate reductase molybdenum cofactor assembly chaperone [Bacillales bacterium]